MEQIMRPVTIARKSPFAYTPDPNKPTRLRKKSSNVVYWVQPKIKCIVQYQEITNRRLARESGSSTFNRSIDAA